MADPKPSPVEIFKIESNYLRGTIADELSRDTDHFDKGDVQLLKHYGTYQQDDRDTRGARDGGGKSLKHFSFMVRTRVPGGRILPEQLLAELDLCDEVGNTTLRMTSRQALQLHGIVKSNLHQAIHRINQIQLSTLAACGDVNRNVLCCPAPRRNDPLHQEIEALTDRVVQHLAPKTKAYYEIWVKEPGAEEDKLVGGAPESDVVEPIYGKTYLPRKFKTAICLPHDNCIDIYANDLGLLAVVENGRIIGYNVLVGGSMGVTPSAAKTFPAVAKRMGFITPDQVLDVATAIVKVQRDFGNRSDRKVARMKYLINNWGLEAFKAKVEEYYGKAIPECHPTDVHGFDDHIGWHEQGDGRLFYGLNVENGRIYDNDEIQLKTALRKICRELKVPMRITAHQSLLFCDLREQDRATLTDILREHHVPLSEDISNARRWSMACVAWPTCGLAITESERALPGIIDDLEVELDRLNLSDEVFTLRMTGCPNGCARPYNCDLGIVGKAAGRYTMFVGGHVLGNRLGFILRDMVPAAEIVPMLTGVFTRFKNERLPGESVGDFCHRQGGQEMRAWAAKYAPTIAVAEPALAE